MIAIYSLVIGFDSLITLRLWQLDNKFRKGNRNMQISRHWRMNSNRYRLEGVKAQDGSVSIQNRLIATTSDKEQEDNSETQSEQATLSAA